MSCNGVNIKQKLIYLNMIEKGEFLLRSGGKSNIYFNVKKAYGNPGLLSNIADNLFNLFDKNITCVAASGHGGLPLATVISQTYDLPLVLVRQEIKDHGLQNSIDGYIPNKTDNVAVVDDVFTTGSSLLDTISILKSITNIEGCYVVFRRTENDFNYKIKFLFDYREFL